MAEAFSRSIWDNLGALSHEGYPDTHVEFNNKSLDEDNSLSPWEFGFNFVLFMEMPQAFQVNSILSVHEIS